MTKGRIVREGLGFITYVCVDCRNTTMLVHGITTNNNSDGWLSYSALVVDTGPMVSLSKWCEKPPEKPASGYYEWELS